MESTIVVASNRGPVSFDRDASGALAAQRGAGGLVTALSGVFFRDDTTWVAAAMTDGDREVAVEGYEIDPDSHQRVRFVVIPPDRYDAYYNQIANRILWFLHHYLWDTARTPTFDETTEATWQEFVEANRSFAVALAEEGDRDPVYLIQDYHLCAGPGDVARAPSGRAHRPLHPHAVRGRDVSPHPAGAHARRDPARHGGRRRRRVPGAAVGRELPPVGAGSPRRSASCAADGSSTGDRVATVRAFPVAVSAHPIRETAATTGDQAGHAATSRRGRATASAPAPGRPARAVEEHPAGLPRVRAVPAEQPVVAGAREVPRALQPVARGVARVPGVRRRLHGRGRADQQGARDRGLAADRGARSRRTTDTRSARTGSTTRSSSTPCTTA